MKSVFRILIALVVIAATVLTIAPCVRADEAGSKQIDETRLTVEKSSLSKEAKLSMLTKADRAVRAGIPAEDVAVIITRGLGQGVESVHIEGFLETATRTKEQGLPARLVLDRIEQGLAKGVPAKNISGVTKRLSENLAVAKPIVSKLESRGVKSTRAGSSEDAVETVARALEKSITRDAVMSTGERVKEQKGSIALFNRAVDTMTTFVGSGMTAKQAVKIVHMAADKGYSERDLDAMERYLVDELRKNHSMNEVAANMESRMERGEMMRDMQEGSRNGPMGGPGSGNMGGGTMRGPGSGNMGSRPGMGGR